MPRTPAKPLPRRVAPPPLDSAPSKRRVIRPLERSRSALRNPVGTASPALRRGLSTGRGEAGGRVFGAGGWGVMGFGAVLDLVLPQLCAGCGAASGLVCAACVGRSTARPASIPATGTTGPASTMGRGPVRRGGAQLIVAHQGTRPLRPRKAPRSRSRPRRTRRHHPAFRPDSARTVLSRVRTPSRRGPDPADRPGRAARELTGEATGRPPKSPPPHPPSRRPGRR